MQILTFEDGIEHRDGKAYLVAFHFREAAAAHGVTETRWVDFHELAIQAVGLDMGMIIYGEDDVPMLIETSDEIRAWQVWSEARWAGRLPWRS